jgi:four helix bundle protein
VWEKAHDLTLKVYLATKTFPKEEMYGLISQMRRSAVSIPTNIAEGCGRESTAETIQFFNMATGSASELEYQLILAGDLHYMEENTFTQLSDELGEVRRMIYGFIQKLKEDS